MKEKSKNIFLRFKNIFLRFVSSSKNRFLRFVSSCRWLFRIFPILITLCILVLIFCRPQLYGHSLFLRYIATILVWPAAVIVAILTFRGPISDKIKTIEKARGWGGEIDWPGQRMPAPAPANPAFNGITDEERRFVFKLIQDVVFTGLARFIYQSQVELLFKIRNRGFISYDEAIEAHRKYLSYGGRPDYTQERYFGWLQAQNLLAEKTWDDVRSFEYGGLGDKFVTFLWEKKYGIDEFRRL